MGKQLAAVLPATMATLMLAAPVLAQPPLADVARQERERRAAISEEDRAKVYTNDDLRGGPRLTTAVTVPQPAETDPPLPSAAPPDTAQAETLTEEPDRDEAYWRGRITAAREAKQRAELVAAALQNRVDGLWAQFTARDDPFQRATIEQDRLDALDELASTQADVERLDQEIRDIREEARRAGVPAGWLR